MAEKLNLNPEIYFLCVTLQYSLQLREGRSLVQQLLFLELFFVNPKFQQEMDCGQKNLSGAGNGGQDGDQRGEQQRRMEALLLREANAKQRQVKIYFF